MAETEFITGESDPADYTVAQVVAHLDANPGDADRVMDLEEDNKARAGILSWEAPTPEATVVDPRSGDVVAASSEDAPQVGDTWTEDDGYTREVISVS